MKTERLLRQSLSGLSRHRLRTFFIMLSGVVGIAALTFVLSVGDAARQKMLTTVRQIFGESSIVVIAGGQQLVGGPRPDAARLTMEDLEAVAQAVPDVVAWDPQQVLVPLAKRGNSSSMVRVLGQSERFPQVWNRSVSRGSVFDITSVKRMDRVAVIGDTVVRELFGGSDPIGAEILIDTVPFTVIGVLEHFGTDFHGMDRDNEIVVPISTLMRRLANVDTVSLAKFTIRDPSRLGSAGAAIKRTLRSRHGLAQGQADDFSMLSPVEIQQMVGTIRRVLSVYLPLAAIIILVAGGILASTLMVSSVNARVGEIGLRRAVGAMPKDTSRQFLIETAMSLFMGGLVGTGLGTLGSSLVAAHLKLGGTTPWRAVLIGLSACLVTGLLAGLLPARRAGRMQPADALR